MDPWCGSKPALVAASTSRRKCNHQLVERQAIVNRLRRTYRRDSERGSFLLGIIECFCAGGLACHLKAIDFIRHAVRGQRRRATHQLKMQMRRDGVASVSYQAQYLSALHFLMWTDLNTPGLHVRVKRVVTFSEVKDDGVSVGRIERDVGGKFPRRLLRLALGD